jgi:hypothetical protein
MRPARGKIRASVKSARYKSKVRHLDHLRRKLLVYDTVVRQVVISALERNILPPTPELKIILETELVYPSETLESNVGQHLPENTVS